MAWIRLEATAFEDRAIRRTGAAGRRVFIAALMLSRARDWRNEERSGWLPEGEFDALEVALHWGDPETPEVLAEYARAIDALSVPGGTLERVDGGWWITGWNRYQPDPTALARKRRERAKEWKDLRGENVTVGHGDDRDKAKPSPKKASKATKAEAGHRDDRDVTARYVHVTVRDDDVHGTESSSRTETTPPRPSEQPPGGPAPALASDADASAGPPARDPVTIPGTPEYLAENERRRAERIAREAAATPKPNGHAKPPVPALPPEEVERRRAAAFEALGELSDDEHQACRVVLEELCAAAPPEDPVHADRLRLRDRVLSPGKARAYLARRSA